MERMKTKRIMCGEVPIGGGSPITIQSMTNTDTRNVKATVEQIAKLEDSGCQIVRCAVPDMEAAAALGKIKKAVNLPIVADIHFDYRLALAAIDNGADKVRINPGNIGGTDRLEAVLTAAKKRQIPIRIGVNSGSLEKSMLNKYGGVTPQALAESALSMVKQVEQMDFENIVVSLKSSDVNLNYEAHQLIKSQLAYPLHIGITESGTINTGKVKSAIGVGVLLLNGIGDTIRVSLTGDPVEEVLFAKEILKSIGIRKSGIDLISCPTCGRTRVDLVGITQEIEERIKPLGAIWEKEGRRPITLAVMGCEVNGPGEAKEADIGIAFGDGKGLIFQKGKVAQSCKTEEITGVLFRLMDEMSKEI